MIDRYTKILLTIIAINLTAIVADGTAKKFITNAWAATPVYIEGGYLDELYNVVNGVRISGSVHVYQ